MNRLNLQPPEKRVTPDDGSLEVFEVFHTIQGEGPFVGRPAVFVRLAGCNLQCSGCDTDYTSKRETLTPPEIVARVDSLLSTGGRYVPAYAPLIVLTGGEPLRQPCGMFVRMCLTRGWPVQIETNGTAYDSSLDGIWDSILVVCSPKAGSVNSFLEPRIHKYKYVLQVGAVDPIDGLPTSTLLNGVRPARPKLWTKKTDIYVQPLDEQDETRNIGNMSEAVAVCLRFGYNLCLQVHKIAGLP